MQSQSKCCNNKEQFFFVINKICQYKLHKKIEIVKKNISIKKNSIKEIIAISIFEEIHLIFKEKHGNIKENINIPKENITISERNILRIFSFNFKENITISMKTMQFHKKKLHKKKKH